MIRMIPMIPAGIICNIIIGLVIGRLPAVVLICEFFKYMARITVSNTDLCCAAFGCFCTGIAGLLFAVMDPSTTYWAFGFPAAVITVTGADFVFAGGSLFIAKLSLPHEQSLSGGLFQTMAQVSYLIAISKREF